MKRFVLVFLALAFAALQAQDGPQHDAHPDWADCNTHKDQVHKCFCMKATTRCPLPGDEPTEPGNQCSHWCNKKRCGCHGPGCTS